MSNNNSFNHDTRNLIDVFKELQDMQNVPTPSQKTSGKT